MRWLLLCFIGFVAVAGAQEMYTNPVFDSDFPDPDVLVMSDTCYAYATNAEGITIQVARSSDLVTWELLGDALPELPAWAVQDFGWARYYLFYSANLLYAVGYAVADDILGPYEKAVNRPILATSIQGGVVGPGGQDVVIGPDGNTQELYHAWAAGGYRSLHLARLDWEDGAPRVEGAHLEPRPGP